MDADHPNIEAHYRTGRDDLEKDFFVPCLLKATAYRRAAGYFSSTSLVSWASALPRLAAEKNGLKVKLLISPELSEGDRRSLLEISDEDKLSELRSVISDRILLEILGFIDDPSDLGKRSRIFCWLVANGRIEIRFGFPNHIANPGIFHEKIGIFDFPGGSKVAFIGSANETSGGLVRNYESLDVYRSWIPGEEPRIETKIDQFDESWAGNAQGLTIRSPSKDVLEAIQSRAATKPANFSPQQPKNDAKKWRHQDEALERFLEAKHGILEMATGTGKTRTAIKIIEELLRKREIDSLIISTEGTDLLDQWVSELANYLPDMDPNWITLKHFGAHHEINDYIIDPSRAAIIVSRGQLAKLLPALSSKQKSRTLIIHDEVHGLGTPAIIEQIGGQHKSFRWRLGLSATPERAYDSKGNEFLANEIGSTIYEFPLEKAIQRGILCEFDYVPLSYSLTGGDKARIQAVYARQAARARAGAPMSKEEVWIEISKVYKTAENKPKVFKDLIGSNQHWLDRCIIFVETRDYGEEILYIVDKYTSSYRTYYAEDHRDYLREFSNGGIDCLITCHRISQGIDIRSLKTVILFSSARSKLETIQRIGRCLRTDPDEPGKRALVVDFTRENDTGEAEAVENADQERARWLMAIAATRRE